MNSYSYIVPEVRIARRRRAAGDGEASRLRAAADGGGCRDDDAERGGRREVAAARDIPVFERVDGAEGRVVGAGYRRNNIA